MNLSLLNTINKDDDFKRIHKNSDSNHFGTSSNSQNQSLHEKSDAIPTKSFLTSTLPITDDRKFAMNEISRINNKLDRFKHKSLKLWEKKYNTIEPEQNKLRRRIKEFKISHKKNNFIKISTTDSFFDKDQLNTINHTNKLIKEFQTIHRENNPEKNKPNTLSSFLEEKQEITMKSYLIKIIENERDKITHKNLRMAKSINDIENKLDGDLKLFQKFKEIEKIKQKDMERIMNDQIKENKNYYDKKKELMQQNKILLDEIDRVVKMINNLKDYRAFVYTIFGKEVEQKTKPNKARKTDYDLMRGEKDMEKIAEELIKNYSHLVKEKKSETVAELLQDHKQLIKVFVDLEEQILRSVESRQEIEESNEKYLDSNRTNLKELEEKFYKISKEREMLKIEKEIVEEQVRKLKKNSVAMINDKESTEIIKELYSMTCGVNFDPNSFNKKPIDELLKELSEYFKKREFQVINYIKTIDEISAEDDEKKLKKIIENRKETNKNAKLLVAREKLELDRNLKKKKAEDRMHRIILEGKRNVERLFIDKKKGKINQNETVKKDDDGNLLLF